jgi:hypothetical protein
MVLSASKVGFGVLLAMYLMWVGSAKLIRLTLKMLR